MKWLYNHDINSKTAKLYIHRVYVAVVTDIISHTPTGPVIKRTFFREPSSLTSFEAWSQSGQL